MTICSRVFPNPLLGALAFTTGNDIFLSRQTSTSDEPTLAHELTHVIQQRSMHDGGPLTVGPAGDTHEQQAEELARKVTSAQASPAVGGEMSSNVQRLVGNVIARLSIQRQEVSNPYAGTDKDQAWQQGYNDGHASPGTSLQPPAQYTPDAQQAYTEGVTAGQPAAGGSPAPGTPAGGAQASPASPDGRYTVVSSDPPVVRVTGPLSDETIAADLYGDPSAPVQHLSDFSQIAVQVNALQPAYRSLFDQQPNASPVTPMLIKIAGTELMALGTVAETQRTLYNAGTQQIYEQAQALIQAGKSTSEAARFVVEERNALKVAVRAKGPAIFEELAEFRNQGKYGNSVGPTYENLLAKAGSDEAIIAGVQKTSSGFNATGPALKILGAGGMILVSGMLVDSPAAAAPLPTTSEKEVEVEQTRLQFGIPPGANIDGHGHLKPGFYLQVDVLDPHAEDEFAAETEEILWFIGVDITYHYGGVTWTVPGR
jgi:Domain of unknown function (DUF4157)